MTTAEALELARETLHEGPHTTAYWIDRADILARALIDLAAKCERYERVVEAAVKWKKVADDPGAPVWKYTMELDAALDALAADKATP
jgi:hypothetical protein